MISKFILLLGAICAATRAQRCVDKAGWCSRLRILCNKYHPLAKICPRTCGRCYRVIPSKDSSEDPVAVSDSEDVASGCEDISEICKDITYLDHPYCNRSSVRDYLCKRACGTCYRRIESSDLENEDFDQETIVSDLMKSGHLEVTHPGIIAARGNALEVTDKRSRLMSSDIDEQEETELISPELKLIEQRRRLGRCCLANTVQCFASCIGITVAEYCRRFPHTIGCPKGNCADKQPWCSSSKALCRLAIIARSCPKTCRTCNRRVAGNASSGAECKDEWDEAYCTGFELTGMCVFESFKEDICKKTCGNC